MRKFLIPAILLSAFAVSAPASAQNRDFYRHQGAGIERQLDQIEQQIDRARDRHFISRDEARRFERQAEYIDRLHDRYRRNGLTSFERRDLQNRIDRLRRQFRWERHASLH